MRTSNVASTFNAINHDRVVSFVILSLLKSSKFGISYTITFGLGNKCTQGRRVEFQETCYLAAPISPLGALSGQKIAEMRLLWNSLGIDEGFLARFYRINKHVFCITSDFPTLSSTVPNLFNSYSEIWSTPTLLKLS